MAGQAWRSRAPYETMPYETMTMPYESALWLGRHGARQRPMRLCPMRL